MNQSDQLLKYADSEDKCYGVAGMTIAMFVFNAEKYLSSISIDRADLETLLFNPEFHVAQTQHISAKYVWNHLLNRFNLTTALLISNLICRYYFHRHISLPDEIESELLRRLEEEGKSACDLEAEEVKNVFNKNMAYISKTFNSRNVEYVAKKIVDRLQAKHELSVSEITELM